MKLFINKEILKTLGGGVALTVALSLGARSLNEKMSCQIDELHAHKYTSITGLNRYVESCEFIYDFMLISEKDVKYIDEKKSKELKFLNDNDLFLIEDNIDKIKKDNLRKVDFTEYEHEEEKLDDNGETYVHKYWDKNIENCNGNARDCFYVYEAYKIEDDQIIKSDKVDNLLDIKDEYSYIKTNYYEIIRSDIYQIDIKEKTK